MLPSPVVRLTELDLRQQLLVRLAALGVRAGASGAEGHGPDSAPLAFSYCVYARERLRRTRLEQPAIVVVVKGVKELWHGDVCERFTAGVPFVISAGTTFDMVNIPDPRTGRFESVCIHVDAELREAIRRAHGREAPAVGAAIGSAVPLSPDLVEAYGHAASALADPRHATILTRHRILEILLLIASTPAARPLFAATLVERADDALRRAPGRTWRSEDLARELGLGDSTLRRRLRASGTSFRALLLKARMTAAGALLGSPEYTVAQAAEAAGYSSRSHFARRFRAAHGVPPRRMRAAF